jgi:hypothetical protein
MKIVDGRFIYEMHECSSCDGKGEVEEFIDCPNDRMTMRGKKCPHCDTTNKHHHLISTGKMRSCGHCEGKGKVMENDCDKIPEEIWQSMTFKVYKTDRPTTINDAYYGIGCVWSCMDYGEHKNLTDEQLIDKVRHGGSYIQATKISDKEGNICDHIGIVCKDQGYVVHAVDKEGKVMGWMAS